MIASAKPIPSVGAVTIGLGVPIGLGVLIAPIAPIALTQHSMTMVHLVAMLSSTNRFGSLEEVLEITPKEVFIQVSRYKCI